jgi:hypothetical protein
MLNQEQKVELLKKFTRAQEIMAEIMEAGDSGSVCIHYGASGLQIKHERTERPTPVKKLIEAKVRG